MPRRIAEAAFAGAVGIEAGSDRAGRRRLRLGRRARRHAGEAEDLRGGQGRGQGQRHGSGAAQGDRRAGRQAGRAPGARARRWKRSPEETGAKVREDARRHAHHLPAGPAAERRAAGLRLPKGGATSAPTADGKARVILRVAEIIPAPAADAGADRPPEGRARAPAAARCAGRVRRRPADALRPHRQRAALKQALGSRRREQPDYE